MGGREVFAILALVILIGAFFDLGVRTGAANSLSSETNVLGNTKYWRECHYFTFRGPSTRYVTAQSGASLPECPMLPPSS